MVLHSVVRQAWTLVSSLSLSSRWEYKSLPLHLAPSSFWLICIWVRIKLCLMSCELDLKFTLKEGVCREKLPRGEILENCLGAGNGHLPWVYKILSSVPRSDPLSPQKSASLKIDWKLMYCFWISVASFPSGFRTGYLTNKLESVLRLVSCSSAWS